MIRIQNLKRWYYPGVGPMLAIFQAGVWIPILSNDMPVDLSLLGTVMTVWLLYRLYTAEMRWRVS